MITVGISYSNATASLPAVTRRSLFRLSVADMIHLLKPFDDNNWFNQASAMRFRIE
jgi:hypothetical protein